MKKFIHKTIILILISLFFINYLFAEEAVKEEILWHDFEEGIQQAKVEGKDIIIDFYTDWCHWCHEMDKTTFADSSVIAYMNENFIPIRVNAEKTTDYVTFKGSTLNLKQLTTAFGISGFPSYAFLTKDADMITVVPGFLKAQLFINILKYIDQACYDRQITFDEFMQKKGDCE